MQDQRTAIQTHQAKVAWSRVGRPGQSIFDFSRHPGLLSFVDEQTSGKEVILVVGGGRGLLAQRFQEMGKTAFNFDVAEMTPVPFFSTISCDMEAGIPFQAERYAGRPKAAITPFSMEYTNIRLSSGNIADVLSKGDVFVWLCHNSNSYIVNEFRKSPVVLDMVARLKAEAEAASMRKWRRIANQFEKELHSNFEFGGLPSLLSCPLPRFLALRHIIEQFHGSGMRPAMPMLLLIALRLGYERLAKRDVCLAEINKVFFYMERDVTISTVLLGQNLRSVHDLVDAVDKRFALLSYRAFLDGSAPLAHGVSFERL